MYNFHINLENVTFLFGKCLWYGEVHEVVKV